MRLRFRLLWRKFMLMCVLLAPFSTSVGNGRMDVRFEVIAACRVVPLSTVLAQPRYTGMEVLRCGDVDAFRVSQMALEDSHPNVLSSPSGAPASMVLIQY